ncbi:MAG: NAD(P)H-binding protein [Bacteroidota bacterium]
MKLLILGASGGCGQWLCRLATERGHMVRALVRDGTPFSPSRTTEVLRGSVLDRAVLDRAVDSCEVVVSALGIKRKAVWNPWSAPASPTDLTTRVAEHMVAVLPAHGITRVVAISAGGVAESRTQVNPLFRNLIDRSTIGVAYADLARMEQVFAASDLDWMAVRPVTLAPGSPTGRAHRVDHYGLASHIRRSDVAAYMLNAVVQPAPFENRTPMIAG